MVNKVKFIAGLKSRDSKPVSLMIHRCQIIILDMGLCMPNNKLLQFIWSFITCMNCFYCTDSTVLVRLAKLELFKVYDFF